ncbi:MAG: hypothetical protein HQL08_10160 [Nitrospirae bacterium]|nr:hypothetical protein [Nitrospirota bacterium]
MALAYVVAMGALGLHLSHCIQSAFQTAGLNGEKTFPVIVRTGTFVAILISLGFAALPLAILTGLIK